MIQKTGVVFFQEGLLTGSPMQKREHTDGDLEAHPPKKTGPRATTPLPRASDPANHPKKKQAPPPQADHGRPDDRQKQKRGAQDTPKDPNGKGKKGTSKRNNLPPPLATPTLPPAPHLHPLGLGNTGKGDDDASSVLDGSNNDEEKESVLSELTPVPESEKEKENDDDKKEEKKMALEGIVDPIYCL